MKIVAKNGVDGFKTIEECLEYEEMIKTVERTMKAKEEELKNAEKTRTEEIRKMYTDLMDKVSSFEKDYNKMVQIPAHGYDYVRSFKYS